MQILTGPSVNTIRYACVLEVKDSVSAEIIQKIKTELIDTESQDDRITMKKERPLTCDNITKLHINGQRTVNSENNCQYVKRTFNRIFTASVDNYQVPGTDVVLNRGQSILAVWQKLSIVNLYMLPDASIGSMVRWGTVMSPKLVHGIDQSLIILMLCFHLVFIFPYYYRKSPVKFVALAVSMWALKIILRAYFKWYFDNNYWHRKIIPLFLYAFALTYVLYWMETLPYSGTFMVPLLCYEACRLLVMIVATNKNKRKMIIINSIKKHLRLPMLAFLLRNNELFHQEATAQIFGWKFVGSGLDTVYRLTRYCLPPWCWKCWSFKCSIQTNREYFDEQDNNEIEFMDEDNRLVYLNRSLVAMEGYYVEGYYIDLCCQCVFILILACKNATLWKWVILRIFTEILFNFVNVYISKTAIVL